MSKRIAVGSISFVLLGTVLFFAGTARAQTSNSEEPQGTTAGNYNVQQSAEVGYRKDWIDGNMDTYDTFVNLGTGTRLLDYTLNIRSINHQGLLFDDLNFSNFGYGGDPDNVTRLRVEKNKWYDLSFVFRRHRDFWDYNLLANPLNPIPFTPSATAPVFAATDSPHALNLTRRMQDYDLMLLPQSRVRFRLGYSRDVNEGPALTSYNGTVMPGLAENFRMTTNAYRMGVDFRYLPKTTISYDQFLQYDKQDTSDSIASTPLLVQTVTGLAPGTMPVSMGINWYYPPTATTVPCAAPLLASGYANTACKMVAGYSRFAPARNFMPTERLSFQSTYFKRLEMSGSASYSRSHNVAPNLYDSINEWTASATSQVRDSIVTGPADAKQFLANANWSAIYSLTQKIRIVDNISYDQVQNGGYNPQTTTSLFATGVQTTGQTGILLPIAQFAPLVSGAGTFASICTSPFTAVTCPQHSTSAAADAATTLSTVFMGQRLLSNTIQVVADVTKWLTVRVGYLYESRQISDYYASQTLSDTYYPGGTGAALANDFYAARGNCPYATGTTTFKPAAGGVCMQNADNSVTWTAATATIAAALNIPRNVAVIGEHVGLAGLTFRPMDSLRINSDFEFGYNDYSYTRIWPRQIQSYKIHGTYRPRPWAVIDGAVDIHENRDNIAQINNLEHSRTYSFSLELMPNEKLAYTLGYNYTDLYTQTYICFNDTFGTMTGAALPTFAACPISNTTSNNTQGALGFYSSKQHYVYSDVMWKPIKRLTTGLGYSGTFSGGSTLILNPLQPAGTLAFNYMRPFASVQIDLYKGLSYKTTWNFYAYDAKAPFNTSIPITGGTYALDPIGSPDFNGSTLMFAMRYAF